MLSTIASFLFGGEAIQDVVESVEYETREEEDEWLLVDVSDPSVNDAKENEIQGKDNIMPPVPFLLPSTNLSDSTISSLKESPPASPTQMEESWSLTPPSCFTAGCPEDKCLEISPIENLLIEHPSMSVYDAKVLYFVPPHIHAQQTRVRFISSTNQNEAASEQQPKKSSKKSLPHTLDSSLPSTVDKRIRHPAELSGKYVNHQASPILPPRSELLEHIKEVQPSQQAKEYREKKQLKRSQLNRQNRVYQYKSSVKNARRKDRWQHHSGANNNRKCC